MYTNESYSVLKLNHKKPRAKELPRPHIFKSGMKIMIKCRGRDEEGVLKTVISNDVEGQRVECQETTGCVRIPRLGSDIPVF